MKLENASYLHVVKNLDIDIRPGEKIGIIGPSGAGKTTVLRLLSGTLTPTEGKADPPAPGQFSYIPQDLDGSLNPRQRVEKLITEPVAIAHGRAAEKRARQQVPALLESLGLDRAHVGRKPSSLSGGQRQRVGIARALITHPSVIFADEPTASLDHDNAQIVLELLNSPHLTVVFVSHDLKAVEQLCDRILTIEEGRLTATLLGKTPPNSNLTERTLP